VVTDEDLLGDEASERRDRPRETLPRALTRPGQHSLDVLGLVGEIPLDGQLGGRNRLDQAVKLAAHQLLKAALGHRIVGGEIGLEGVESAGGERQPHLEPQLRRDHAVGLELGELAIGGDRVVDPRPGVEAQLADAGADAEHGRLIGVAGAPRRRLGL
jgi:hypothetical protein